MAKRGPKPTPTAILEARGSWRAKHRSDEPKPRMGRPRCPCWLSRDAKRFWHRLLPKLESMGILTVVDGPALAEYCQTYANWKEMVQFLGHHGKTYAAENQNGQIRYWKRPEADLEQNYRMQLLRFEQEFGLTPASRPNIKVAQADKTREAVKAKGKGRFFKSG